MLCSFCFLSVALIPARIAQLVYRLEYRMDDSGFHSWQGKKFSVISKMSRPAKGAIQPPEQGFVLTGVKQQNEWNYTFVRPYAFMACTGKLYLSFIFTSHFNGHSPNRFHAVSLTCENPKNYISIVPRKQAVSSADMKIKYIPITQILDKNCVTDKCHS